MGEVIQLPKLPPKNVVSKSSEKTCANGFHLPSAANPRVCKECFAWPLKP